MYFMPKTKGLYSENSSGSTIRPHLVLLWLWWEDVLLACHVLFCSVCLLKGSNLITRPVSTATLWLCFTSDWQMTSSAGLRIEITLKGGKSRYKWVINNYWGHLKVESLRFFPWLWTGQEKDLLTEGDNKQQVDFRKPSTKRYTLSMDIWCLSSSRMSCTIINQCLGSCEQGNTYRHTHWSEDWILPLLCFPFHLWLKVWPDKSPNKASVEQQSFNLLLTLNKQPRALINNPLIHTAEDMQIQTGKGVIEAS